ncbi:MAG: hypothetical protein ACHREM_21945 [Polyangiales bacterium]
MRGLRFVELVTFAAATSSMLACSSPSAVPQEPTGDDATTTEASADASDETSDATRDARPDAGVACLTALPTAYACPVATSQAPSTACTDLDLHAYFEACWGPSWTDSKCSAWSSPNAACTTCISAWSYPDGWPNSAACYLQIDPTATTCAAGDECEDDCTDRSCEPCETQRTFQACFNASTRAGGECFDLADEAKLTACRSDPKFADCQINAAATDILVFFRGACRDGGKWGVVHDAGVDATESDAGDDETNGESSTDAGDDETTDAPDDAG